MPPIETRVSTWIRETNIAQRPAGGYVISCSTKKVSGDATLYIDICKVTREETQYVAETVADCLRHHELHVDDEPVIADPPAQDETTDDG